jgi:hypothetical protein
MLFDMRSGVVFFDEMDPLVATRSKDQIFVRQAMTTVLLPKLSDLYDQRKVLFFMATNHFGELDPAIRRPQRFDFLLCMGPPSWVRKLESLKAQPSNWKRHGTLDQLTAAYAKLVEWSQDDKAINDALDLFTVGETHAFYDELRAGKDLGTALTSGMKKAEFGTRVTRWGEKFIGLHKDSDLLPEYLKNKNESRRQ